MKNNSGVSTILIVLLIMMLALLMMAAMQSNLLLSIQRGKSASDSAKSLYASESTINDIVAKIFGNYPSASIPIGPITVGSTVITITKTASTDANGHPVETYNIIAALPNATTSVVATRTIIGTGIDTLELAIAQDCTSSMDSRGYDYPFFGPPPGSPKPYYQYGPADTSLYSWPAGQQYIPGYKVTRMTAAKQALLALFDSISDADWQTKYSIGISVFRDTAGWAPHSADPLDLVSPQPPQLINKAKLIDALNYGLPDDTLHKMDRNLNEDPDPFPDKNVPLPPPNPNHHAPFYDLPACTTNKINGNTSISSGLMWTHDRLKESQDLTHKIQGIILVTDGGPSSAVPDPQGICKLGRDSTGNLESYYCPQYIFMCTSSSKPPTWLCQPTTTNYCSSNLCTNAEPLHNVACLVSPPNSCWTQGPHCGDWARRQTGCALATTDTTFVHKIYPTPGVPQLSGYSITGRRDPNISTYIITVYPGLSDEMKNVFSYADGSYPLSDSANLSETLKTTLLELQKKVSIVTISRPTPTP